MLRGISGGSLPLDPSVDPNAVPSDAQVNAGGSSSYAASLPNTASLLDGYKITSFSPTRAIINGPGGSRIVFDNEEIVLGGVPWFVTIKKRRD